MDYERIPPASPDTASLPLPPEWTEQVSPFIKPESAPGAGPFFSISCDGVREVAALSGCSLSQAMAFCLERNIWPLRFTKNRGFFSGAEQARMLQSQVTIIGCGGLGGHVAMLLARLGIGSLVLCDKDRFEESNLNRQNFCREDRIGMHKVLAAKEDIRLVASHIALTVYAEEAAAHNLPSLLQGSRAAIDCLDNIPSRRFLEAAAHKAGIPCIHGSLAGHEGFALISFPHGHSPERSTLSILYGDDTPVKLDTPEYRLGVPSPTPMAIALLQALLTIRVLTDTAGSLKNALWHLDLAVPELECLRF